MRYLPQGMQGSKKCHVAVGNIPSFSDFSLGMLEKNSETFSSEKLKIFFNGVPQTKNLPNTLGNLVPKILVLPHQIADF